MPIQSTAMHALLLALVMGLEAGGVVPEPDFKPLFNGKDLTGWEAIGGPADNWQAKEGVLSCTGKAGAQWLATSATFDDFELRLEFQIPEGGNSGVFLRAPKTGSPWVEGLEIQVLDDDSEKYKNLKPAQYTGSIYAILPPAKRASKKAGEWQTMRIRCAGRRCDVWLNGELIVKGDLDAMAQQHTQPGLKRTTGHIGLQNHSSPVFFRNLRVQRLR